jgi:DNA-binding MarR family transcriptional regulator
MSDDDVAKLQRLYPQIYIACHQEHIRAASTKWRISSQDSAILVHLDRGRGLSPRELAGHLGIKSSTLSAYIARLSALGYLTSEPNKKDARRREIRLTEKGAEALSATSVLDSTRVRELLKKLKPEERKEALRGLELLARAAKQLKAADSSVKCNFEISG